jgi:hypothetical protein
MSRTTAPLPFVPARRSRRRRAAGALVVVAGLAIAAGCSDGGTDADTSWSLASVQNTGTAQAAADGAAAGGGDLTVAVALPQGPTSGVVRRAIDGSVDTQAVEALAAALGLQGQVVDKPGGWVAPDAEPGSVLRLQVLKDATGSWTYDLTTTCDLDTSTPDGGSCSTSAVADAPPATTDGDQDPRIPVDPALRCADGSTASTPSTDQATAAMAPLATASGANGAATVADGPSAGTSLGGPVGIVVDTVIDERAVIGLEVRGRVGLCAGNAIVLDANGFATGWEDTGASVPLIDATAGVERLKALPQPAIAELCRPSSDGQGCLQSRREIVGAVPGLLRDTDLANDRPVVVPAWIYTVRTTLLEPDGTPATGPDTEPVDGTVAITSIADSALSTPSPAPVGTASSEPGGTGDGSSDGDGGVSVPGSPGTAAPAEPADAPQPVDVPEPRGTGEPIDQVG